MSLPLGSAGVGVECIDPSPTDALAIINLTKAIEWCGVSENAWRGTSAYLGGPNLLREFVMLPHADWCWMLSLPDLVVDTVVVTSSYSPMDKARLISMRRVCRMRCGLTPGDPEDHPAVAATNSQSVAVAIP